MYKQKIHLLIYLLLTPVFIFSQLQVTQGGNINQIVQNTLIGQGIIVSNVTYTGDIQSLGTFATGANPTNLGITDGVIISSGAASDAVGPNSMGSITTQTSGGSDPQLQALIPGYTINDASFIEFDFVPVSDTIKFRYVFGSDEYPEFVNSNFNDVFGFFLSGINPNGGMYSNQNIAIIPGTSLPVTIDNVNAGLNNQYYVSNTSGMTIEYDGFTTVLTAWALVLPCTSYHIKLAVADAGDSSYDSAVFLEAYSFTSNTVTIDTTFSSSVDTMAIEGCNDAIVTFKIPNSLPFDKVINYLTVGSATNGTDYNNIGNSITIPAGQDSVNLTISPVIDGIIEGVEELRMIIAVSSCDFDTLSIYIRDNDSLLISPINDTTLCNGSGDSLIANVTGGIQPYSYLWNTGDTNKGIFVNVSGLQNYTVTVTDACNTDTSESATVAVSNLIYSVIGDSICNGDTANVYVTPSQNFTFNWETGDITYNTKIATDTNTYVSVVISDSIGCSITDSAEIILLPNPNITITNDQVICRGDSVALSVSGASTYTWSTGQNTSTIYVKPNSLTTYSVTAYSSFQCSAFAEVDVDVIDYPDGEIIAMDDTICRGAYTTLTAQGGNSYLWDDGQTSAVRDISISEKTEFGVYITNSKDGKSCSVYESIVLDVIRCNKIFVPNAFSPDGDGLNDYFTLSGNFEFVEKVEMIIYDRWGKIIYQTTDLSKGWNGEIDGEPAANGVYSYVLIIHERLLEPYSKAGTFHLIR